MSTAIQVEEYRPADTRNFIRVGDIVKVKLGNKSAFLARLSAIEQFEEDGPLHFKVIYWAKLNGDAHGRKHHWRYATADDITRVSQTRWAHLRSDYEEGK